MNETIMGYRRKSGRFGIRNQVLVISLVQCANSTVTQIASRCGVPAITIDTGCGEYHDQEFRTIWALYELDSILIYMVSCW